MSRVSPQLTYISAPEVGGDVDRRQGRLVDLCVVVGVDAHLLPPERVYEGCQHVSYIHENS